MKRCCIANVLYEHLWGEATQDSFTVVTHQNSDGRACLLRKEDPHGLERNDRSSCLVLFVIGNN